jgi:hypothetical protein
MGYEDVGFAGRVLKKKKKKKKENRDIITHVINFN